MLTPLQVKGRQLSWSALWFGGGRETSSGVVACLGGWCHDLPPLSHLFCWLARSIGSNGLNARQASSHVSRNYTLRVVDAGHSASSSRIDPSKLKPSRFEAINTSQLDLRKAGAPMRSRRSAARSSKTPPATYPRFLFSHRDRQRV